MRNRVIALLLVAVVTVPPLAVLVFVALMPDPKSNPEASIALS